MAARKKQLDYDQRLSAIINENSRLLDDITKQIVDYSSKKLLIASDNRIVYANPKIVKAFGLKPVDYKDKPVNEIIVSSKGDFQLGHYLAISSSLKKNNPDQHLVRFSRGISKGKWYLPILRRCYWKGKASILIFLEEVNANGTSSYDQIEFAQRCKLAINKTDHFVWDYNINSGDLFVSPELFSALGYRPNESEGDSSLWFKKLHNDYRYGFEKLLEKLKQNNELPRRWDYQVLDKNCIYRWFTATWQIVEWDSMGIASRIIGIHSSIDEQKRVDLEKEEYQKTLNGFIENAQDGLVITDEKGVVQEWNPSLEQITQVKKSQAVGKFIWDVQKSLVNSQDPAIELVSELEEIIKTIVRTGKNPFEGKALESSIRLKNLEPRLVQQSIFLIKTSKGTRIGASVKDVTESKTTRKKIEKSEERLKLALGAGNVGIWDIDLTTSESYFSPMTFTIFGYRPLEVEPTEELWKQLAHPQDIEWVSDKVKKFLLSGDNLELEFRMRKKNGTYIWILSKNRIIRDVNNKPLRVTGTITDITRQKDTETELRLGEARLTKNLHQHELISEISYILNTNKPFNEKNNEVLKLLGTFTNVSRVYIFEDKIEKGVTVNTFEWCNEGIKPEIGNLQSIPLHYVERWGKGKDIIFSNSLKEDLDPDFAEMMIAQGIKSFIIFALKVSGKKFGLIGFDECNYERKWDKEEVELLRTISNLISFSYERHLVQLHYQLNEQRYRELTEMLPQIIFEVSMDGKIDFLNQTGCDFFGVNRKMLSEGLHLWHIFPLREVVKMRLLRNSAITNVSLEPFQIQAKSKSKAIKNLTIYIRPRMEGGVIVSFSGIALQPD